MTWTPETKEEAKRLWNAGLSAAEIGMRVGKTRNAVIGLVHRAGIQRSKLSSQISNQLKNSLRANAGRKKFNWNEARDERLGELFAAGALDGEIAKVLGTTPGSVQHRRKSMRLLREPAGGFKAAPLKAIRPPAAGFIFGGCGALIERSEAAPPKATVVQAAWAPLPGVKPMLRDQAADRHCKWPITVEGDELSWCCSAVATEGAYCAAHSRRSVKPNQPDEIKKSKRQRARELSHAQMMFRRVA
jgi:hypothetical protein